jgi:tetratricopeptide (TPR) repeat protein
MKRNESVTEQDEIIHLNYQITYDSLPHKSLKKLPYKVKKQVEELHTLTQTQPKQVIVLLLDFIEKYPNIPIFYNFLVVAYNATGQKEKAEAFLIEAYQKHSDYLFAKTNYALYCLRENKPEKIPEIFNNKFDLKLLYPRRKIFHITEFTAFNSVVALYHHKQGHHEIANKYYLLLKNSDPKHHLTKMVKRELHPNFFQRFLDKIAVKIQRKLEKLDEKEAEKRAEKAVEEAKKNAEFFKKF